MAKIYFNKKDNKILNYKLLYKLITHNNKYFMLIYYFVYCMICLSKEELFSNSKSIITLTIKGKGNQKILSDASVSGYDEIWHFNDIPNQIYVNNIPQNKTDKIVYSLTEQINNITLIWNYPITKCCAMFYGLNNIIAIDLSNFNSSLLTNMAFMFGYCSSLTSINLKNFDTSLVTIMGSTFTGCTSLKSLDLSHFNTSSVTNLGGMFFNCTSLISLNISNFDTSLVTYMGRMFYLDESLKVLDLSSFKTPLVNSTQYMFYGCKSLISINMSNFITSNITNMESMFQDCSSLISLNLNNFNTSKVDNSKNMIKGINSQLICCIDENNGSTILSLFNNYNKNCNNICFLDDNHKLIPEQNLCIDNCYNNDDYKFEYNNICYNSCPNGTHNSSKEEFICKSDSITFLNFIDIISTLVLDATISTIVNENEIEYTEYTEYIPDYINSNLTELLNTESKLENNNETTIDNIQQNIREGLTIGNFDDLINNILNNSGDSIIIDSNDIKYEITLSNNNNIYKNISIIKLGECQNILKNYYSLSIDEPLIIFKVDIYKEYSRIPTVEYEVYDLKNKSKLNLDLCQDLKIEILIPVLIDEKNEYIYNLSSGYYNNICYSFNKNTSKDIILEDRKKEYIDNNLSLCEQDCEYEGYDTNIKKSKCNCFIKIEMPFVSEIVINKDKLLDNFINIKDITNLKIIYCYKELFSVEGLKINIGNYIILSIILINIGCFIFFSIKDFKLLNHLIDTLIKIEEPIATDNIKTEEKSGKKTKKKNDMNKKDKSTSNLIKKIKRKKSSFNFNFIKTNEGNIIDKSTELNNILNNKTKIIKIEREQSIIKNKYNDNELNTLLYEDAIKIDKRTYLEYYLSLIKSKQIILFTFLNGNDYNLISAKICLLFFSFVLYFTVNTLFFNDKTMHKIYIDDGKYNIIYQIPIIIYSSLISSAINIIIKYLSLVDKDIIEFKKQKSKNNDNIKKRLKIKFILFFLFDFLLLILFWYYISCFCAIYKNTQKHLIKDTLITFGLSMLYPFYLCLLPGLWRIPALRAEQKDKKLIYKLSTIIEKLI